MGDGSRVAKTHQRIIAYGGVDELNSVIGLGIAAGMPDELANATVRTQLRFLEEKGAVTYRREGKKFLYRAIKPKKNAAKTALRSVLNVFFGGSIEDAVATHLADPKSKLSSDQLERLRNLIDEHSKAKEDR